MEVINVMHNNEYISKLDVVRILQKAYAEGRIKAKDGCVSVLDDINALPAADVQPVKLGYWKDIMMSEATGWDLSLTGGRDDVLETVCSVCEDCCAFDGDGEPYLSSYCPNCGAYMGELTE